MTLSQDLYTSFLVIKRFGYLMAAPWPYVKIFILLFWSSSTLVTYWLFLDLMSRSLHFLLVIKRFVTYWLLPDLMSRSLYFLFGYQELWLPNGHSMTLHQDLYTSGAMATYWLLLDLIVKIFKFPFWSSSDMAAGYTLTFCHDHNLWLLKFELYFDALFPRARERF